MIDTDLKKLEELSQKMEAADLPLEDSLKLFSESVELIRSCREKLEKAELKIQEILGSVSDLQEEELS